MSRIYPQLAREEAVETLKELEDRLKGGAQPSSLPDGTLHPKTSFNGFGGTPVNVSRLRELHRSLKQVLSDIPEVGRPPGGSWSTGSRPTVGARPRTLRSGPI